MKWMQKFRLGKDKEKEGDGNGRERKKKEGKRSRKKLGKPSILFSQYTTHVDFLTFSPHFQPLYASFSLLLAPAPTPGRSDRENPAPAVTVAGSFGSGLCCSHVVLLGTASVAVGEETSHQWEDQFGGDTWCRRLSGKGEH